VAAGGGGGKVAEEGACRVHALSKSEANKWAFSQSLSSSCGINQECITKGYTSAFLTDRFHFLTCVWIMFGSSAPVSGMHRLFHEAPWQPHSQRSQGFPYLISSVWGVSLQPWQHISLHFAVEHASLSLFFLTAKVSPSNPQRNWPPSVIFCIFIKIYSPPAISCLSVLMLKSVQFPIFILHHFLLSISPSI